MNEVFEKILEELDKQSFYMQTQGMNQEKFICTKKATEIIKKVSEEYNSGWVPCSERLPEEELEKAMRERGENAVFPVLATINKVHLISGEKYKIVSRAFYGQYNDKNFYNSCCDRLDVIAWQPLPEPYQPKGE